MVWLIIALIVIIIFCWYCLGAPNAGLVMRVLSIIPLLISLIAFPAALSLFPYLAGLGIFFALAAFVCYWIANPPAITDWHGGSKIAATLLLTVALLAFGAAKRSYDLSQPLTVAEGYIIDFNSHRGGSTIDFRTINGETLKLNTHEQSLWYDSYTTPTLRRISFIPTENDIVIVEHQSGSRYVSEFEDRRWHNNPWTFAAYVIFILGIGSGSIGFRNYSTGDTVAEKFAPEQSGEHWEIATDPDGKEHFVCHSDRRPYGSPDIPPEAGA